MRSLHNRHLLAVDLLLIPLAVYASFVLRLDTFNLQTHVWGFVLMSGLALLVLPPLLFYARLYQSAWRYVSTYELLALLQVVGGAVLIISGIVYLVSFMQPALRIPRSIPLIFLPLALAAVSGPRLAMRVWAQQRQPRPLLGARTHVLVFGAGDAGAMVVRELRQNPQLGMHVVGLLDDDPLKHGLVIHGSMVLGQRESLPALVARYHVAQVIIAMPSAPGKEVRAIMHMCQQVGVQTLTVPSLAELLDGKFTVSQLRKLEISDLLRREPVQTDIAAVRQLVRGKRVLVTGGGGSIGSELCRQLLRCAPAQLLVLGHGENSVFELIQDLNQVQQDFHRRIELKPLIADVRDARRMQYIFAQHRPELVFHAAAHKHVPLMECNPIEAFSTNVLGTRNLLAAAEEVGVEHFVMISSDKAVNPTSIMGATKRLAEFLVLQAAQRSQRSYAAVRFGNVLGSRGSVVLSFKRQIAAGGPITVTHPDMRRYFMTIPEAVQLVLQAATLGHQGEVFMLEMGEPIRVVDLARDMIRLSGLEEGRDIDIVFTGLRPGEKLFEELFANGEYYRRTSHDKIFRAEHAMFAQDDLPWIIAAIERCVEEHDEAALLELLPRLVPEYQAPKLLAGGV
ncbi:polysaccharide biosynthesis protein [Candidatus Viridilinea mediisalina]|nr:nucleoside-diphosphate sugar epimerase/dehydratase [Candidatus Viridilinea mediisalina]